jgi:ABC-2 type transport system permease protein
MDVNAIYVLWLREIKRFFRSKARIVGTLLLPIFFLLGLGFGFNSLVRIPGVGNYIQYIVPGIVGMTLLFVGSTSGFMVIWDRQFGFLKEIMVTPNSRMSIALGRIAGGATTAIIPAVLILFLSLLIGFQPVLSPALLAVIVFIVLIGICFISVGLIVSSFVNDPQAYGVIVNFFTFPLFFLSGAIFPLSVFPGAVQYVAYANPLTYGVDGLRYALLGTSSLPLWLDLLALLAAAVILVVAATWAVRKSEVG